MSRDRLLFIYDANVMPVTFDACWAITWADIQRKKRRRKFLDILIVNVGDDFVFPRPPTHPEFVSNQELRFRVEEIVKPIAMMHKNVATVNVCESGTPYTEALQWNVFPGDVLHAPDLTIIHHDILTNPERPAGFTAREGGRYALERLLYPEKLDSIVAITIRESPAEPARNSRLDQWNLFAVEIRKQGFKPIFVPDTSYWFEKRECSGLYFPEIALNLQLRVALYEAAAINLFVNNGPGALCHLSPDIPYLCFKMLREDTRLATREHLARLGFIVGKTPPIATDNQKWVWEDDLFPTIYGEFTNFCETHGVRPSP